MSGVGPPNKDSPKIREFEETPPQPLFQGIFIFSFSSF
jgi:hypothetical protein